MDRGKNPRDTVGHLDNVVKLKKRGRNFVDAATATLVDGIEYYYNELRRIGVIRGVRTAPLEIGEAVSKLGRMTGRTRGKISAIEVDDLLVEYDAGDLLFDDQIEVEPARRRRRFSRGGDSGSLVVDSSGFAVGLLFAGNDVDATYLNPIAAVLNTLRVELVF